MIRRLSRLLAVIGLLAGASRGVFAADFVIELNPPDYPAVTVFEPFGYAGNPTALVLLLHGYTFTGAQTENYFQLKPHLHAYNFFTPTPPEEPIRLGNRFGMQRIPVVLSVRMDRQAGMQIPII